MCSWYFSFFVSLLFENGRNIIIGTSGKITTNQTNITRIGAYKKCSQPFTITDTVTDPKTKTTFATDDKRHKSLMSNNTVKRWIGNRYTFINILHYISFISATDFFPYIPYYFKIYIIFFNLCLLDKLYTYVFLVGSYTIYCHYKLSSDIHFPS